MSKTIEIDGAIGEGGGQVLRTSLALSLITGQSFHMRKIRAGRAKPGLQAQHLMSVKAAAEIGRAKVRGAHLGSSDLLFEPGEVTPGGFHFKIGTAGATSLVLHTIYLPLALAGGASSIVIEGGTHVKASPCFHFLAHSWRTYMQGLGIQIELTLDRVGFYPRGGGLIRAQIEACAGIQPFCGLATPSIASAIIHVGSAGIPDHVADRLTQTAVAGLASLGLQASTMREVWSGGPGCMLGIELPTAPAPTFFFGLGEKGKSAEAVAADAVDQVAAYLTALPLGVDEHSADQLLLPLALAAGRSEFPVSAISSHLRTNADIIRKFVDRGISCLGEDGEPGRVVIS
jgi:RNA 3'-phosphate cyclase